MKRLIKRISTILLCGAMVIGDVSPVLADSSTADVYATQGTSFNVTIPKTLILDGTNGSGAYTVSVKGNIAGSDVIKVVPDSTFKMSQSGKRDIDTAITQSKTEFTYGDGVRADAPVEGLGTVQMASMSAGK